MSRIKVHVTPSVLEWAREQAGLSIEAAARVVAVEPERIRQWESGEEQPTPRQARLLGKAYRRPTAFFFLREHPQAPPKLPDFRLPQETDEGLTPQLIYEISRARSRREAALEIMSQREEEPIRWRVSGTRGDGPVVIAQYIRDALNISLDSQQSWKTPYEALRQWMTAAENSGVLVFHFSNVESESARGFSLASRPLPVVAVNGKDTPHGRIFTIFHELAHVALNAGGVCDLHDRGGDWMEPFCNQVAAEALVPRRNFAAQPLVEAARTPQEWSDQELRNLSNRYMVSREVILRRLLTLGKTTRDFYETKRRQFIEEYRRAREEGSGFLPHYRRILRDNGVAFTSLVIDAYRQEVISARDLSHFLGDIKLSHLENIAEEITASGRH